MLGRKGQYNLPLQDDPEGFPITMYTKMCDDTPLVGFIYYSIPDMVFEPKAKADLGTWCVKIILSDTIAASEYTFKVDATNTAPKFVSALSD